jgi:N-acetylneuraminic acid mutarotase
MSSPIVNAVVASSIACAAVAADGHWQRLADIPDAEGFAGSFAGVVEGGLVVAGGANFPDAKPWEGGTKRWHDRAFLLDSPAGRWREAGRLPRPLGYGVAVTTPTGLLCIGGSDERSHRAEVFELQRDGEHLQAIPLQALPVTLANMCGALVGRAVYVAGGQETPAATAALARVWTLDLDRLDAGWQEIEPLPGRGRILAAAGALGDTFVVAGGAALEARGDGQADRVWLRDAWAFDAAAGDQKRWRRIADLPRAAVAAPSPMPLDDAGRLLLLGGDDGTQVGVKPSDHAGFPRDVLAWDPAADAWVAAGEVVEGLVTTPTVNWGGAVVVPGGELRPGIRSNHVWRR